MTSEVTGPRLGCSLEASEVRGSPEGGSLGGRGGDTEGGSSEQMGDMLDPDTEMLGDVAGELVANLNS